MLISDIQSSRIGGSHALTASLVWEDQPFAPAELFIKISGGEPMRHEEGAANAFFVAAAIPAMIFGETRLKLDKPVCPGLLQNVRVALAWLNAWFEFRSDALRMDISTEEMRLPNEPPDTACFFTGGVDAWSTLLRNRDQFSSSHPGSIRSAICAHGLQRTITLDAFDSALEQLKPAASQAGVDLISVHTNIYSHWMDHDPGYFFWTRAYNGAALAALAHAVYGASGRVLIASSDVIETLEPWGTHPVLDPCYGSFGLTIWHDAIEMTRLDKIRQLAKSEIALRNLRVCDKPELSASLNCGACEKCIRTMLMLEAVGVMHECTTFPEQHLSAERTRAHGHFGIDVADYFETQAALRQTDRPDLVAAIDHLARRWRQRKMRRLISDLDARWFGGVLRKRLGRSTTAPASPRL